MTNCFAAASSETKWPSARRRSRVWPGQQRVGQQDRCQVVHLERRLPPVFGLLAHVENRTRVVDDHVEPRLGVSDAARHLPDLLQRREVRAVTPAGKSLRRQGPDRGVEPRRRAPVQEDREPVGCEPLRQPPAETAGSAGDQHDG
jgi:hypothetical protein